MATLSSAIAAPWFGMPLTVWGGFLLLILFLLLLDLGVFHRKPHEIGLRESLALSTFFITLGLAFSLVVGTVYYIQDPTLIRDPQLLGMDDWARASKATALYLTGYLIEQSLSLDNIFIISLVFSYFEVPRRYQHAVLFWGVLGVIVMRGLMIFAGAAVLKELHWVLYLFAAFLIVTGFRMLFAGDDEPDIGSNPLARWLRRWLRVSDELHGDRFVIKAPHPETGKQVRWATRLLLCLATIEFVDLIFAVDSVPAIFSITQEPFLVYTSNIFAILGLRSLYFALSAIVHRFHYLKYSLALILVMIGAKIVLEPWSGKFPPEWSLAATVTLLLAGILFSLWRTREAETAGK